ncbi:hypothetical protein ES703_41821 [subsurface metagenome]
MGKIDLFGDTRSQLDGISLRGRGAKKGDIPGDSVFKRVLAPGDNPFLRKRGRWGGNALDFFPPSWGNSDRGIEMGKGRGDSPSLIPFL